MCFSATQTAYIRRVEYIMAVERAIVASLLAIWRFVAFSSHCLVFDDDVWFHGTGQSRQTSEFDSFIFSSNPNKQTTDLLGIDKSHLLGCHLGVVGCELSLSQPRIGLRANPRHNTP